MHSHAYTRICVYTHMCVHAYTRICVYKKRTHICVYTHMCVHAYTRICVYKKEHTYVCTRICVYALIHAYVYTRIYTHMCVQKKNTHMCVHAYVCTRLYTHMCVHAYTRICVYTHIHGYVCMCVRVNAKSLHMRLSKRAAWPTPWNGWPKVRHGPWVGHGQKNGHPKHPSGNCKPFGVQPTRGGGGWKIVEPIGGGN